MSRPDRTTMEGMIWNANHVLEQALDPGKKGLPKGMFSDSLKGIVLISVVEVGFIFSGNVGTGICLAKKDDGTWSAPCAVGLTGVGWGFLVGGSIKEIILFCYGDQGLAAIKGEAGLKLGGQLELTLGPLGRTGQVNLDVTNKGVGSTIAVAYSKGAFLGASVEGSVVGARQAVNQGFYGQDLSPTNILFGDTKVPEGKVTLINEVYDKLGKLQEGATAKPDAAEEQKKSQAKSVADAEAEKVKASNPDVVRVDASAEAAKGK